VRVRFQSHWQRGPKAYALRATDVECIGKGKARARYEVWLQDVGGDPGH
jgi:IS5 family transposase